MALPPAAIDSQSQSPARWSANYIKHMHLYTYCVCRSKAVYIPQSRKHTILYLEQGNSLSFIVHFMNPQRRGLWSGVCLCRCVCQWQHCLTIKYRHMGGYYRIILDLTDGFLNQSYGKKRLIFSLTYCDTSSWMVLEGQKRIRKWFLAHFQCHGCHGAICLPRLQLVLL